jgi:hypothetical protein
MEEKLREFIGKKVHITFESKKHKCIFNLTGILTGVDWQWSYFIASTSDYPFDYEIEMVNTLRIRTVEEVSNEKH